LMFLIGIPLYLSILENHLCHYDLLPLRRPRYSSHSRSNLWDRRLTTKSSPDGFHNELEQIYLLLTL
jgi:hypothetical protein